MRLRRDHGVPVRRVLGTSPEHRCAVARLLVVAGSLDGVRDDDPRVLGNRSSGVRIGVLDGHEQNAECLKVVRQLCVFPCRGVLLEVVQYFPQRCGDDLPVPPRVG